MHFKTFSPRVDDLERVILYVVAANLAAREYLAARDAWQLEDGMEALMWSNKYTCLYIHKVVNTDRGNFSLNISSRRLVLCLAGSRP